MNYDRPKMILHCSNCGLKGHNHRKCKEPKISLGIIAFQHISPKTQNTFGKKKDIYKYLLICRKHTLGFVEFIRGKFLAYNVPYMQRMIDQMTLEEKQYILEKEFVELWNILWYTEEKNIIINCVHSKKQKREFFTAKQKFEKLRSGYYITNKQKYMKNALEENKLSTKSSFISLEKLILLSKSRWKEPEWGFPKGRRNLKESNMCCAKREFTEETGVPLHLVHIFYNIKLPEEIFIGSNNVRYKHIYYVGHIKKDIQLKIDEKNKHQISEISDIGLFTLAECLHKIRPYNREKQKVLLETNLVVEGNDLEEQPVTFQIN
jgi:ADP-ribose pyrophosphatase YjhB (NUDIX family)